LQLTVDSNSQSSETGMARFLKDRPFYECKNCSGNVAANARRNLLSQNRHESAENRCVRRHSMSVSTMPKN